MDDSELMYHSENTSIVSSHTDHEYTSTTGNSEGRMNEDVQETRLVIGLDYGTTYTGMLVEIDSDHCCRTNITFRCGVCDSIWVQLLARRDRRYGRLG
jgi:hypothetical protein